MPSTINITFFCDNYIYSIINFKDFLIEGESNSEEILIHNLKNPSIPITTNYNNNNNNINNNNINNNNINNNNINNNNINNNNINNNNINNNNINNNNINNNLIIKLIMIIL